MTRPTRPVALVSLLAFAVVTARAAGSAVGELIRAAQAGNVGLVKQLVADDPSLAAARDPVGKTALHWAGTRDVAAALIASHADLNALGGFGQTPLWEAASDGRQGTAEALLGAGADPNLTARDGSTALHRAAGFNEGAIVQRLVAAHADLTRRDDQGRTALALAVERCRTVPVKLLLDAGSDAAARDGEGRSLLDLAGRCRANEGKNAILTLLRAATVSR